MAFLLTTSVCVSTPAVAGTSEVAPLVPSLRLDRDWDPTSATESVSASSGRKRYILPMLLSAAIPGAGEIQSGHWLRGLPLVAAEVATWLAYDHFQDEGHRIRDEFEAYADAHWEYQRWQSGLEMYFGPGSQTPWWDTNSPHNCDCSPPFIPFEEDPQEYYENAGKYRQFRPGWDDWSYDPALDLDSDSTNRRTYVRMRIDSNENFDNGTRMITVAAVTRLVSVVQSFFLVRAQGRNESLRLEPMTLRGYGTGMKLRLRY